MGLSAGAVKKTMNLIAGINTSYFNKPRELGIVMIGLGALKQCPALNKTKYYFENNLSPRILSHNKIKGTADWFLHINTSPIKGFRGTHVGLEIRVNSC